MPRHRDVAVDLVGHDDDVVLDADVKQSAELSGLPHAPDGVVWAAEQKQTRSRVRGFYGEVFEVDAVARPAGGAERVPVGRQERVFYDTPPAALDGVSEGAINGWLDDHAVAFGGEAANGVEEGGHDARGRGDPVLLGWPSVPATLPKHASLVVLVGRIGVPQAAGLGEARERLCDGGRKRKLHVRDG